MLAAINCDVPLTDVLCQVLVALKVLECNRLGDTAATDAITPLALAASVR